jgi:hypothetical protein
MNSVIMFKQICFLVFCGVLTPTSVIIFKHLVIDKGVNDDEI